MKDVDLQIVKTGGSLPANESEPTEECKRSLDQMITLSDGAFKRWAFDAYNAQLANARSYMWIASALLAAHVALFKMLTLECWAKELIVLIPLGFAAIYASRVFVHASQVAYEHNSMEMMGGTASLFSNKYESGGEKGRRLYEYKVNLLKAINKATKDAFSASNIRGQKLRESGTKLKISIWFSVLALLGFLIVH